MNNQILADLLKILQSVLSAFFGVQSQKQYQQDFTGKIPWWIYLMVGIVLTILLVLGLIGLTHWVLHSS
ncbi:MAG: DUF2970 domain-containing protein [Gammaproteobacteria bacterium]